VAEATARPVYAIGGGNGGYPPDGGQRGTLAASVEHAVTAVREQGVAARLRRPRRQWEMDQPFGPVLPRAARATRQVRVEAEMAFR
jgi:hypothetical protein